MENCVVVEYKEAEKAVVEVFGVAHSKSESEHGKESSGEDGYNMVSVDQGNACVVVDARGDPVEGRVVVLFKRGSGDSS